MNARNANLTSASVDLLAKILSEQGISASEIVENGRIEVDEPEKVRLHFGNRYFYAFDFRVSSEVNKCAFEELIGTIKTISGVNPSGEQYEMHGYIADAETPDEDYIGWYLTRLP